MKKIVLVLTAAFLLTGCASKAHLEFTMSLIPTLLNKEKREAFMQVGKTLKSAKAFMDEGQYGKAMDILQRSIVTSKKIEDKYVESAIIQLLGSAYFSSGEYEKGIRLTNQAYEQMLQLKKNMLAYKEGIGTCLNQLAGMHDLIGNHEKAEYYYEEALGVFNELQANSNHFFANHATVLMNIGILYLKTERYQEALPYLEECVSKSKSHGYQYEEASGLSALSGGYYLLGKFDKAVQYKRMAITSLEELGHKTRMAETSLNMAEIYIETKQPDNAYQYLKKSLETVQTERLFVPIWEWRLYQYFGQYYVQRNEPQKAIRQYENSLYIIEAMRSSFSTSQFKTGYLKNKLEVYDEYIQLLNTLHRQHPEKGYDRKSFEIFERRQGRAFLEEMGKTGARQYSGLPEDVRNKEMRLEKQIGLLSNQLSIQRSKDPKDRDLNAIRRIEQELENAKSLLQQLEQEIEAKYPDYYALKYPKPIQIEDLQQDFLRPGEAMLVYHVMEDQTCLWTISKTHFSGAAIDVGRDELNQKIGSFRKHALRLAQQDQRGSVIRLKQKEDADIQEIPDLHDLLFPANLQHRISRAQNLYIVPTGPLYLLPFEALKTKNDHYLIEKQGVSYLSSASLLGILRQSQARRDKKAPYPLLAFANPVYKDAPSVPQTSHANPAGSRDARSGKLPELRNEILRSAMQGNFIELPETEDEAKEIRDILNAPSASDPLQLRQKASRNNVLDFNAAGRLDDYRYLVFACHGVIPDSTSIVKQPALVLSHPDPATNGDGFLTMSDVFALKMNADLATLSACNTGRGESVPSEGVMGLTRAFMYAGAPAVTVTLWSINSLAAKELNVGLFKHLKTGKGRMRALRQIKLAMIDGEHGQTWRHPYYWAPLVMFGDGN